VAVRARGSVCCCGGFGAAAARRARRCPSHRRPAPRRAAPPVSLPQYARALFESYWFLVLPTGAAALLAPPGSLRLPLALAACALDVSAGCRLAHAAAAARLPAAARALEAAGAAALPALAEVPAAEAAAWPVSRRWEVVRASLVRWAAWADVYAAVLAVVGLALPPRPWLLALLLMQLQMYKFTLSLPHREAWAKIDARASAALGHRLLPPAVGRAYATLAAAVRRQVKSPEDIEREARARAAPAAGAGGVLGSITDAAAGLAARARQACAVQ
jgi:hypothetical protein